MLMTLSSNSAHPHFPHLFTPLQIKGVTLRNRIAISGHHAGWWVDGGRPSDEFADYIEERARGGVGLFVIGCTSPQRGSGWLENVDDRIIPRYRKMVEAGHRHGTPVFAQLAHPGFGPLPGVPIAKSPLAAPGSQPVYRGPDRHIPSIDELQELIAAFGAAATRAAKGGVDGIEVHSHESFLHSQMLNPMWNTREDEYGGSLENRMRFLVETLRAMRASIGPEMPLGVRLKADDMEQRGMDGGDYAECIARLEAENLVDYVNLTGGDARFHHGPSPRPEGEWLPLVKTLRGGTKLIVMHAGRVMTPEMAEAALAEGAVDVVCMTKAHIADGQFARKVFENRVEDIRFCTRCLQGCHHKMHLMTCIYNPVTSRETQWATLHPATTRKRLVVVGGGPAGMKAAVTASARGHEVIVLERAARVGGQIWTGASSPGRESWARIAEFYERQAQKGAFEVRYETNASAELIAQLQPDAVILATGSSPIRAEIAGGHHALTVHEALQGDAAQDAKHATILDREGFMRPIVVADALSSRGVQVEFVTPLASFGPLMEHWSLDEWTRRLQERGVRFWPAHDVTEWNGVARLRDVQTGEETILDDVDTLVGAVGSRSVNDLVAPLRGHAFEVHVIGDANFPQTVEQATFQGARLARLL